MTGPLAGLRVLNLGDEKAALCTRRLAEMGADVQRPELDLSDAEDRAKLNDLVKTADVLVETCPPGFLAAFGLGYEDLQQINPGLIMISITGFGQDGPYRDYKSADIVAEAVGGWLSVCGEPEFPLKPYGQQSYNLASLNAAIGVMLALRARQQTGCGQHIDISLQECVAASLDHVLPRYFALREIAARQGSRHWNGAFRVFPCRDGYILLSLQLQWETLVEWLAVEGMAADLAAPSWCDRDYRGAHLDHVIAVLERWTRTHTVHELVTQGQALRFPWAPIASIDDLLANPQLKARGFWKEVPGPDGKRLKVTGPVFVLK